MKKKLIAKWITRFFSQREINRLSETNKFVYKYAIIGLFIPFFSHITFAAAYSAPLVNGGMISSAISTPYEEDSYTFTANAGEGVQIRVADTSSNDFRPRITLYDPNGAYVTYDVGYDVAAISHAVTENGTYTVVVADGSPTESQTANYDLYFHAPGGMDLIANAGPDQIICSQLCDGAVLDGRKSYALNSVIASYDWELKHRDDANYYQTATGETPTIYNLASGIYDVTLTITDDADFQATDQMILTVIETCNGCSIMKGDLDSDGDVDGNDLRIFSQNYGTVVLTP
jgi:K319L-like, PKD domain